MDKAIFRLGIQKFFITWWLKCLMIQKKLLRSTNSLLGGIGMFMLENIFLKFFGYWYFQTSLQSIWPAKTMYWPRSRRSVQSKEYWRLKVKIDSLLSWDQVVRQSWAFLLVTHPHHSHHCSLPYIFQYLYHCMHHKPHYKCHQYHHHHQHNSLLATFLRSGLSKAKRRWNQCWSRSC